MSFNQSRSDKNEAQYRKTGRSQQHRGGYTPVYPKGSGAAAAAPPSLPYQPSFKKTGNNAQSRGNVAPVNPTEVGNASTQQRVGGPSGAPHVQPQQYHGAAEPSVTNTAPKQPEPSVAQRGPRAVPKAPAPQPASVNTESRGPSTPVKSPGDASKGFAFQFGSISPGLMNGMQVPARTSSAPPNLVEQKRDQAQHEPVRPVPALPTPSVPKQQLPRKDQQSVHQSSAVETHLQPKAKKDVQGSPAPHASQTQKPSVPPMSGISMTMPFHQPHVSMQFGGPNQQIQSQGMPPNSIQMPMPIPLPIGSGQVQQPVFVPGLQHHPMQPHNIMHQGQNLGFTSQMGPQLPQLGNMGMGIGPQYPHQQGGNFTGPRKTAVKITHPDTHEELRLDKRADSYQDGGSSAARSHPNVPQSQPIPSFAGSHPAGYYNSYNPNMFYPSANSHPLTSSHMPPNSQAPRFSYPVSQGPSQSMPFMNPSAHPPKLDHARDGHNKIASVPSAAVPVTVKPAVDSSVNNTTSVEKKEYSKPSRPSGEVISSHAQGFPCSDPSINKSTPVVEKVSVGVAASSSVEGQVASSLSSTSVAPAVESRPVVASTEVSKVESLNRSNSIKEQSKKPVHKVSIQLQHQTPSIPSQEHAVSSSICVSESVEGNTVPVSNSNDPVSEVVVSSSSNGSPDTTNVSDSKNETDKEADISSSDIMHHSQIGNSSVLDDQGKQELVGAEKQSEGYRQEDNTPSFSSESTSVKSSESVSKAAEDSGAKETVKGNVIGISETAGAQGQDIACNSESVMLNAPSDTSDSMGTVEVASVKPSSSELPSAPYQSTELSGTSTKHEAESVDITGGVASVESIGSGGDSLTVSGSKDKQTSELSRTKSAPSQTKKKWKEILSKADAAGGISDLYGAYTDPAEKKDVTSSVSADSTSTTLLSKQEAADSTQQVTAVKYERAPSKAEPDDWEDAADISTPKLENSSSGEQAHGDKDVSGYGAKKYSKDFLLKFSMQFLDLPEGFEITLDISEILNPNVSASASVDYESLPSPGRIMDRLGSGRIDRRGSGMIDDGRWNKGGNANFRPVQGGVNYGVLRSPDAWGQAQHVRGILPGPIAGSQGGMHRNNTEADRWQRGTNYQPKGLMPSPLTPLQVMHKAERKYEVGKVSDEEQAKQRQLKAILNKLTPQNFEKLFEQVKAVNIDNATTLTGVISQIFDKALMEPTFCEMYANFCFYLAAELPDFSEDNEKITFKRVLLNKCQEEFGRGEREQEEADKADEEGEVKQSEEEREEKRIKARRRMLGNIRLIGELYKKKMLTERIMHECIKKLLGQQQTPDEEDIESLCKLMSTIGEMIDHLKAKEHMDAYFERMKSLSNNMKLSSRVRFMLKDTIDLRKNKWQQRRKVEGPKKIEDVHRDAAQERHLQATRLNRGGGMNPSARRGPPMEFSPRGSSMSSPSNVQMGGFRGMPSPARGYGNQDARGDVRADERHSYEGRTLSVPLTQRPMGDESITLGPQGGLARGMSVRGPPSMSAAPLPELSPLPGESRRMTANGFSSHTERGAHNPREDLIPRVVPDRFEGDHSSGPERNVSFGGSRPRSSDRSFERSLTAPANRSQGAASTQNIPSDKSEEYLRDKSLGAIKEFYSARDENEVALCIKDLNSPGFHPTMISLWVTDSFERKDGERDLFTKLLINLTKSQDGNLSQSHLIEGFEATLSTLEDAVNDAPRAPEFLARIFAKSILENVVSLSQIGQLIREGGEEPGSLLEAGLAGNVLGNILEIIQLEKGDSVLNEIRTSSNLRLESFRPPDPLKSKMLEKFL